MDVTTRVRTWCVANANIPVRLYQTAAGLRLAIVDRPMQAGRAEARRILEELGSDPLYDSATLNNAFVPWLSPKPWCVGAKSPDERFPYQDEASEQWHRDWLQTYESAASGYSTCQLVEVFGPPNVDSTLVPLVELHDAMPMAPRIGCRWLESRPRLELANAPGTAKMLSCSLGMRDTRSCGFAAHCDYRNAFHTLNNAASPSLSYRWHCLPHLGETDHVRRT